MYASIGKCYNYNVHSYFSKKGPLDSVDSVSKWDGLLKGTSAYKALVTKNAEFIDDIIDSMCQARATTATRRQVWSEAMKCTSLPGLHYQGETHGSSRKQQRVTTHYVIIMRKGGTTHLVHGIYSRPGVYYLRGLTKTRLCINEIGINFIREGFYLRIYGIHEDLVITLSIRYQE